MAWSRTRQSERASRLPADWPARRRLVLARDQHRCQLQYVGVCTTHATDVDHDDTGSDHLDHLRAACAPCHARRSSEQGTAARRRMAAARHRPTEPVPGLKP